MSGPTLSLTGIDWLVCHWDYEQVFAHEVMMQRDVKEALFQHTKHCYHVVLECLGFHIVYGSSTIVVHKVEKWKKNKPEKNDL